MPTVDKFRTDAQKLVTDYLITSLANLSGTNPTDVLKIAAHVLDAVREPLLDFLSRELRERRHQSFKNTTEFESLFKNLIARLDQDISCSCGVLAQIRITHDAYAFEHKSKGESDCEVVNRPKKPLDYEQRPFKWVKPVEWPSRDSQKDQKTLAETMWWMFGRKEPDSDPKSQYDPWRGRTGNVEQRIRDREDLSFFPQSVDLERVKHVFDDEVEAALRAKPNLQALSFGRVEMAEICLRHLHLVPRLESLIIKPRISDEALKYILPLKKLEELELPGLDLVTDLAAEYLAELPQLRLLWLPPGALPESGVRKIAHAVPLAAVYVGQYRYL